MHLATECGGRASALTQAPRWNLRRQGRTGNGDKVRDKRERKGRNSPLLLTPGTAKASGNLTGRLLDTPAD